MPALVICQLNAYTAVMLQVMPMYNAEVAPPHLRGGMNILFQWFVTFGILCAGLINYGCDFIDVWGWRLALGLAAIPGAIVFLGGLVMPESPSSLIERGHFEKARVVSACCQACISCCVCDSWHVARRLSGLFYRRLSTSTCIEHLAEY